MATFGDVYDSLFTESRAAEAYLSRRSILEVPSFLALSTLATLIAALVGTSLGMIVFLPMSLLALIFFPILLGALLLALVLAAPVTFVLFPMAAYLLRGHSVLAQFVLPVVGFGGGGAIIVVWAVSGVLGRDVAFAREMFVGIGMVSGLVAGAFYARGLHP